MEWSNSPLPSLCDGERKWGLRYLLFQVCFLSSMVYSISSLLFAPLSPAMLKVLCQCINCMVGVCIFHRFLKENFQRAIRFWKKTIHYTLVGLFLYFLCSNWINWAIVRLFPGFSNLNDGYIQQLSNSSPILMGICTVLLAPAFEEIMHRGLIFGGLYDRDPKLAYLLSTLLFCSVHVVSYLGVYPIGHILLAMIQYLPAGLIFAWCYRRSGTLLTPILIHIFNNAVVLLLSR